MWAIAWTTGTTPGLLVTSMCSIVMAKYLPLSSAASVAFRGLVFRVVSLAMVGLLLANARDGPGTGGRVGKSMKRKSHLGPLRCAREFGTPAIAGRGGFRNSDSATDTTPASRVRSAG